MKISGIHVKSKKYFEKIIFNSKFLKIMTFLFKAFKDNIILYLKKEKATDEKG